MDRVIKITLGIFLVILVAFASVASYNFYVETAYRTSLVSTDSYRCTITTTGPLSNVTLFLPLPVNSTGNSAVIGRIGAHDMTGFPGDWTSVLFGTDKATFLKVTAPGIGQAAGSSSGPVTITFSVNTRPSELIDTRSPLANDAVFRPVEDLQDSACPAGVGTATGSPSCSSYTTTLYAKYDAAPNAAVTIHAEIIGRNDWKIFQPGSNEYRNAFDISLTGVSPGWTTAPATLESGIGSYDVPKLFL